LLKLITDQPCDAFHTISYAIRKNSVAVVRCLLENKVAFSEKLETRALPFACKHGNVDIVQLLLDDTRVSLSERVIKSIIMASDNKVALNLVLRKLPVPHFHNLSVCAQAAKMLASLLLYAVRYQKYENFITLLECFLLPNITDLSYLQFNVLDISSCEKIFGVLWPALSAIYRYKDTAIGKKFLELLMEFKQGNPILSDIVDHCIKRAERKITDTKIGYEYELAVMPKEPRGISEGIIYIDEGTGKYIVYKNFDECICSGVLDTQQINLKDLPTRLRDQELLTAVLEITAAREHTYENHFDTVYLAYNKETTNFVKTKFPGFVGFPDPVSIDVATIDLNDELVQDLYQSAQQGNLDEVQLLLEKLIADRAQPACSFLQNLYICLQTVAIICQAIKLAVINDHVSVIKSLLQGFEVDKHDCYVDKELFFQEMLKPCILAAAANGAKNSVCMFITNSKNYGCQYDEYNRTKGAKGVQIIQDVMRVAAFSNQKDLLRALTTGEILPYVPYPDPRWNLTFAEFYLALILEVINHEQEYVDIIEVLLSEFYASEISQKNYLQWGIQAAIRSCGGILGSLLDVASDKDAKLRYLDAQTLRDIKNMPDFLEQIKYFSSSKERTDSLVFFIVAAWQHNRHNIINLILSRDTDTITQICSSYIIRHHFPRLLEFLQTQEASKYKNIPIVFALLNSQESENAFKQVSVPVETINEIKQTYFRISF
jgi:hypothetical protein